MFPSRICVILTCLVLFSYLCLAHSLLISPVYRSLLMLTSPVYCSLLTLISPVSHLCARPCMSTALCLTPARVLCTLLCPHVFGPHVFVPALCFALFCLAAFSRDLIYAPKRYIRDMENTAEHAFWFYRINNIPTSSLVILLVTEDRHSFIFST